MLLVRQPIGQTTHWSYNSLDRHLIGPNLIGPTDHWSDSTLVRQMFFGSTAHYIDSNWSDSSLPESFQQFIYDILYTFVYIQAEIVISY